MHLVNSPYLRPITIDLTRRALSAAPFSLEARAAEVARAFDDKSVVIFSHTDTLGLSKSELHAGKRELITFASGFNNNTTGVSNMKPKGIDNFYYSVKYDAEGLDIDKDSKKGSGERCLLEIPFVSRVADLLLRTSNKSGGEVTLELRLRHYTGVGDTPVTPEFKAGERIVSHIDNSIATLVTPLSGMPGEGELVVVPVSKDGSKGRWDSDERIVLPSEFGKSALFGGTNAHWVTDHVHSRFSLIALAYHPAEFLE